MSQSYELDDGGVIDPELLLQQLRSDVDVVIVDVRTTAEFQAGHLPGSRSVPLHQLVARASELTTHRRIVLVSRGGTRAKLAAAVLRIAGFDDIVSLSGGIMRWRELGHPIEDTSIGRGDGSQPA